MQGSMSHLHSNREVPIDRQDPPRRSYTAMILSMILPGLGQFYLGKYVRGCILLFIFTLAIVFFYMNSYPVNEWRDLLRLKPVPPSESSANDKTQSDGEIHLWTLEDGRSLMFRPSWIFKLTSIIQAIACWLYAVRDGWHSRHEIVNGHV